MLPPIYMAYRAVYIFDIIRDSSTPGRSLRHMRINISPGNGSRMPVVIHGGLTMSSLSPQKAGAFQS